VETKSDGSPVTEVDGAVEAAMQAIVLNERPGDGFLGEEIGASGSGARRWIFDGIDGTHNYAAGNPAWATMIALEVDGEVTVGVVSSPVAGIRWYAERGGGAWRLTAERSADAVTSFHGLPPRRLQCSDTPFMAGGTVLAVPPEGFMLGWRSPVARSLGRGKPAHMRTYAYYGAAVGEGEMDAAVILNGGPWDFAANTVIVEEAGGEFRDLWGGRRLDTTTMIFSNAKLTNEILDIVEPLRPAVADVGQRDPAWRPPAQSAD
jgi:histidinol-phosphatase